MRRRSDVQPRLLFDEHFAALDDPRDPDEVEHSLRNILLLALAAVLADVARRKASNAREQNAPAGGPPAMPGPGPLAADVPAASTERRANCHGERGAGLVDYARAADANAFARWVRGDGRSGPMPAISSSALPDGDLRAIYDFVRR
jgi:hypothetical protein